MSDKYGKKLSIGVVYASFSFELSWFLCVENVRLSREKKRRFLSKVTELVSLDFFNFMPLRAAIYIHTDIYTLWRGKSRLRRGDDDGGNDEIAEEEGWAERFVGFDREERRF